MTIFFAPRRAPDPMCSEAVLEKEGELHGDSGCGAEATPIDCAFTEAFNRPSPELAEASPRPMLNGQTKRAWTVREHRRNRAVAHSATQGFIHALGVFTDLPQPRELFRHPPSSSVSTLGSRGTRKLATTPAWSASAPSPVQVKKPNIVFAMDTNHKIRCMKA